MSALEHPTAALRRVDLSVFGARASGAPAFAFIPMRCASCFAYPCVCPPLRCEPCVCGESIEAYPNADAIRTAVQEHNECAGHADWRRRAGR